MLCQTFRLFIFADSETLIISLILTFAKFILFIYLFVYLFIFLFIHLFKS